MKNLFLVSALSFALSLGGQIQSSFQIFDNNSGIQLSANDYVYLTANPAATTTKVFNLKNTAATAKKVMVKRYDLVLHSGAVAYFCFAGGCYSPITTVSPNGLNLLAGQSASAVPGAFQMLVTDLDEAATAGYSYVRYTVYDSLNVNDSTQFSIRYNSPVGINELNKNLSSFSLYPNPANDHAVVSIQSTQAFDSKLKLYNTLGELVSEKQVALTEGKNTIELNLENQPAGIYFVNIQSGNSSSTRKLIIK
jgi:Secretion system C-terminal sorting domain